MITDIIANLIEYFNAYKYSTLRHLRLPTQIELTVPRLP